MNGEYDYGCLCCGGMFGFANDGAGDAAGAAVPDPAPTDAAQGRTDGGCGSDESAAASLCPLGRQRHRPVGDDRQE